MTIPVVTADTSVMQALEDGSFVVLHPVSPSAQDFLNGTPISSTKSWSDFLAAVNFVMEQNVEQPIKQLETIRFIKRDSDESVLRLTTQMLGFDLSSDVYKLSEYDILRIVSQLPMYAENSANDNFSKFLDLILKSRSKVSPLWTKDYNQFFTLPHGMKIEEGGEWYKTTHVDLEIELLATQDVINAAFAGFDQTVAQRIKSIFYDFAPITLVLERIFMVTTFPITMGWHAEYLPYIHEDIVV